eukprot:12904658-Prorocentrum_lima.AAC.1
MERQSLDQLRHSSGLHMTTLSLASLSTTPGSRGATAPSWRALGLSFWALGCRSAFGHSLSVTSR